MPTPDAIPADLALRLVVAVERVSEGQNETRKLGERLDRLEQAVARLQPAADAHAAYLARLAAEEEQATAEARAKLKAATTEADAARVAEETAKARARTSAMEWAMRIVIPLLTAALGAGGVAWYHTPETQDAPQHPQEAIP